MNLEVVAVRRALTLFALVAFPLPAHAQDAPQVFAGAVLFPDGKPAAGAKVWLTAEDWAETHEASVLAETRTDAEGRFEFTHVPGAPQEPGSYSICVYQEGWALAWAGRTRQADGNLLFVLEREFPLRGHILDPEGNPVPGIKPAVTWLTRQPGFDPMEIRDLGSAVLAPPAGISAMMVTASDQRGQFEVRHLPPGITLGLSVRDDRYARAGAYHPWRDLSTGKPIEFHLEPPGTIRGRVFRAHDGKPMPGVNVAGAGRTTTDEEGRYELTGLPSGVYEVYLREVPTVFTAKAITDIALEPGATVEAIDLAAIPGVAITGVVRDKDTGEPLANAGVCCNTAQQPKVGISWPIVHTDEKGRYRIRAPEGPAELRPFGMPKGWRSAGRTGSQMKRFTVSEEDAPIEVNFEAVRAAWTVSGTVLGPDGKPVPYAHVLKAQEPAVAEITDTIADGKGQFRFESVKPHALSALHAYIGDNMSLEDCVVEPADETPVTLRLAADARPTLTGRVVGADGKPVAYALVRADTQGTHQLSAYENPWRFLTSHTVADDQGRFTLRALWSHMSQKLRVRCGGYAERELAVDLLAPGEERDLGEIPLDIADLVISGWVVDENDQPVAGAHVDVYRRRGMFSRSFMARTDLDGRFRIEGLPREEVYVHADQFQFQSTHEQVGPEPGEVTIRVIRREDQVQFAHKLDPPLRGQAGGVEIVLRGLYRFRAISRAGEVGEYMGLDLEIVEGRGKLPGGPDIWAFDEQGRDLREAPSVSAKVDGRRLWAIELPEAGARSLAKLAIGTARPPREDLVEFDELRPLTPVTEGDHCAVLWVLELTEHWIEPTVAAQPVTAGRPPYLSARIYAVVSRDLGYQPISAAVLPNGAHLAPRATFYCDPGAGIVEVPHGMEQWEDQLEKEAAGALGTLRDWGAQMPRDPMIVGCWFQSEGGHGEIPLPDALTVTLKPTMSPDCPTVVFESIPLPKDLTKGVDF